jgi:hypothetical protein
VEWTKSNRCDTGNCVEFKHPVPGMVLMRNSTMEDKILPFTEDEWNAFLDEVKAGGFEI